MAKKAKVAGADPEYGSADYQAQSDADTLTRAAEIQGDTDRHQRAADHLEKKAKSTGDAHKDARKHLEKKVKKGLKNAFPGDKGGGTFQAEKDRETGDTEKVVNEKE